MKNIKFPTKEKLLACATVQGPAKSKKRRADHIIVDVETLSLSPHATIMAIGAVGIDSQGICSYYYAGMNLADTILEFPQGIDAGTLIWWMEQPAEARELLHLEDGLDWSDTLRQFHMWYTESSKETTRIWSRGADFDIPILKTAYEGFAYAPWKSKQTGCIRTIDYLLKSCGQNGPFYEYVDTYCEGDTKHCALFDAKRDAILLWSFLKSFSEENSRS